MREPTNIVAWLQGSLRRADAARLRALWADDAPAQARAEQRIIRLESTITAHVALLERRAARAR